MTTHEPGRPFRGCPLYHQSGVLPWDFADRIVRLKEASGLTWSGMARALGVDRKQLRRWRRKGVEPCGGAMLARSASPATSGAAWTSCWARTGRPITTISKRRNRPG